MATTVYLADSRHNYAGVLSTDCMPIGIGYMKAVMDRDLPEADSEVFAYPDDLLGAMKRQAPDVIMLSNYVWNEALSLRFARLAKTLNPHCLVVLGGPNIPNEPERQMAFVQKRPEIDIYVLGEADFLATEIVRRFMGVDHSVERLLEEEIPSSVYRRGGDTMVRTDAWDRRKEVNDIPSPWLTGVMDRFFDDRLSPMIETNRGCPFRCTFCVQGEGFYNKINNFDMERMEAEVAYIGAKIAKYSPSVGTLRIADANYGMYERDVEISSYIARAQKAHGWPTFIDATTGKNRADRIIRSMEQVNGALVLYQAVQSLDEGVLKNINRTSIKLEAYEQIQMHIRGRGLKSSSDLILGLPGESLATHTAALHKMVDAGTNQMHCFQAMMLKGASMESIESREKYKFDTRFRVLPKNFGVYEDEKVFDIEEIIVATDTLPFEDYIKARKLHMTFSVFWNDGWFENLIDYAVACGVERSAWLEAMLQGMEQDTGGVRDLLDSFVSETKEELFDTYEACAEFYGRPENFERLKSGEIGDNLMYKYRALSSFRVWPELCRCAFDATAKLVAANGMASKIEQPEGFWEDFHLFTLMKHAHGQSADDVLAPARTNLSYDIGQWIHEGVENDVADYALSSAEEFEFKLTDEGERELAAAFKVWTYEVKGLAKLVTRIRVSSQVRECARSA